MIHATMHSEADLLGYNVINTHTAALSAEFSFYIDVYEFQTCCPD